MPRGFIKCFNVYEHAHSFPRVKYYGCIELFFCLILPMKSIVEQFFLYFRSNKWRELINSTQRNTEFYSTAYFLTKRFSKKVDLIHASLDPIDRPTPVGCNQTKTKYRLNTKSAMTLNSGSMYPCVHYSPVLFTQQYPKTRIRMGWTS